ncbi:hypothetical protein WJX84_008192, partial [Apatococcus fuscideae]
VRGVKFKRQLPRNYQICLQLPPCRLLNHLLHHQTSRPHLQDLPPPTHRSP